MFHCPKKIQKIANSNSNIAFVSQVQVTNDELLIMVLKYVET